MSTIHAIDPTMYMPTVAAVQNNPSPNQDPNDQIVQQLLSADSSGMLALMFNDKAQRLESEKYNAPTLVPLDKTGYIAALQHLLQQSPDADKLQAIIDQNGGVDWTANIMTYDECTKAGVTPPNPDPNNQILQQLLSTDSSGALSAIFNSKEQRLESQKYNAPVLIPKDMADYTSFIQHLLQTSPDADKLRAFIDQNGGVDQVAYIMTYDECMQAGVMPPLGQAAS